MKPSLKLIAVGLALCAARAPAQEPPQAVTPNVTGGASTSFESRYLWYGLLYGGGAAQQSSMWVSTHGYTFSVWNNYVLANGENHGKTDEVDYSLSTSVDCNGITLEPGVAWWTYPNQADTPSTGVLTLALTRKVGVFSLRSTHTVDVSQHKGAYFADFTLSREWEPAAGLTLEASAGVGSGNRKFNETYIGPAKTAINNATIGLKADWVTNGVTVSPHAIWSSLVDGDIRDSVEKPSVVVYGISVERDW